MLLHTMAMHGSSLPRHQQCASSVQNDVLIHYLQRRRDWQVCLLMHLLHGIPLQLQFLTIIIRVWSFFTMPSPLAPPA